MKAYTIKRDVSQPVSVHYTSNKDVVDVVYYFHGFSGNRVTVESEIQPFVEQGFLVVLPTLRSHSDPAVRNEYRGVLRVKELIDDLQTMQSSIDKEIEASGYEINKRVVAGNSIGGFLACYLASKTDFDADAVMCFDTVKSMKHSRLFNILFDANNNLFGKLAPFLKHVKGFTLNIANYQLRLEDLPEFAEGIDDLNLSSNDLTVEALKGKAFFSVHGLKDKLIPPCDWELYSPKIASNPGVIHVAKGGPFKGHRFLYLDGYGHSKVVRDQDQMSMIVKELKKML